MRVPKQLSTIVIAAAVAGVVSFRPVPIVNASGSRIETTPAGWIGASLGFAWLLGGR
jgi:hypothetical protein